MHRKSLKLRNLTTVKWHANCLVMICIGLFIISMMLEHVWGLVPCVLCQLQRLVMLLVCFFSIAQRAFIGRLRCFSFFSCLGFIFLIAGFAICLRHIWLQNQPLDVSLQCLPSLGVLWQWWPWHAILEKILQGDALCQQVAWRLLGLSLPQWLSAVYLGLSIYWVMLLRQVYHLNVRGA